MKHVSTETIVFCVVVQAISSGNLEPSYIIRTPEYLCARVTSKTLRVGLNASPRLHLRVCGGQIKKLITRLVLNTVKYLQNVHE